MRIVALIGSAIGLFVFLGTVYTHHVSREAHILFHEGSERGDHQKLTAANELFADLLRLQPRVLLPLDWAATQTSWAAILRTLGQMEHSTARLEEAVATYREACRNTPVSALRFDGPRSKMALVLRCGGLASAKTGQHG
jgi:hypothetical protein